MKILITGDKGFVGSATRKFIEGYAETTGEKYQIVGYDLMDNKDIRDAQQLEGVITEEAPQRILHLAAIARFSEADKDPKTAYETNVLGTRNVAAIAAKYHIPLVYASTGSMYMPINQKPPITEEFTACGNSVYGCSKFAGETYVKQHSPHIILRYAHLYGKEKRMHGLIGGFMDRISRGLAPTLYGGKQSNDFTYIADVAKANFLALISPWDKWNQVYNIGTGQELSAEEAGKAICEATGYQGEIEVKEGRTVDPEHFVYDTSKAEIMLGFKADFDFATGLKDMFSNG